MPNPRRSNPEAPQNSANTAAAGREISFRTRGRLRVRVMRASYFGSKSIFKVFAHAHDKKVPVVRKSRVRVDVENDDSTEDAVDERISGMGYNE